MTEQEEERAGVPLSVVPKVLEDNRALVRLLGINSDDHLQPEADQDERAAAVGATESHGALLSTYREVVDLLQILSATSDAGRASIDPLETDAPDSAER